MKIFLRDAEYGAKFRENYIQNIKFFVQSGAISALIIWILALTLARALYGSQANIIIIIFTVTLLPLFLLNMYTVYSRLYSRLGLPVTSMTNMGTGFVVAYCCVYILGNPLLLIFGIMLTVFNLFIYQRVPLKYCLGVTVPYLLFAQYAILTHDVFGSGEKVIISFIVWCTVFFAVSASRTLEYSARDIYSKNLKIQEQGEEIMQEKQKAETLLLNILPRPVAKRLIDGDIIADSYPAATVLFADIEGFTKFSSCHKPGKVVEFLNNVFSKFDDLAEKYNIEKIKTIGDSYMAAGGILGDSAAHAERIAEMALDMLEVMKSADLPAEQLKIRVGMNTGAVIAGVIGKKKFLYDLWSDAVNIASRMESSGVPGKIQVSESTYALLKDKFEMQSRGVIEIEGKESMRTYFLLGKKPDADPGPLG